MRKLKRLAIRHAILDWLIFLLSMLAFTTSSWAATFYVSPSGSGSGLGTDQDNTATLPNALNMAGANGQDDVLYLKADYYYLTGPLTYTPNVSDYNRSIKLVGGWNASFTYKTLDPGRTHLHGGNMYRIFNVDANVSGMDFPISFENISFEHGSIAGPGAGIRAMRANGGIINKLAIQHCVFSSNSAVGSTGGAIYANCYAEIEDSTFTHNSAVTGGAIALIPPETSAPFSVGLAPKIDRCNFDNNILTTNGSSGSDLYSTVSPVIRNSSFRGKDDGTNNGGAAIHHRRHSPGNYSVPPPPSCNTTTEYYGKLTVINSTFSGKRSYYWGGAISIWDSEADIINSLFVDNHAGLSTEDYGCGGAITILDDCMYNRTSRRIVNVFNSTFAKNRSFAGLDSCNGSDGQAIHNRYQDLRVINSVFWDNGPNSIHNSGSLLINYSDLEQAYSGTGNISTNPGFVDFNNNNFRLTGSSLCRDSGTETILGIPLYQSYPTSSDRDGRQRIIDTVDMGAYEFDTSPYAHAVGRGDPNLAHDPVNNRYLAVYNNTDGSGGGRLYGRLVNPDGTPFAAEFPISEQMSYKRMFSAAAYDAYHNKFVTIWDIFNASSNDMDIQGQLVNPDGSLDGWNYVVSNKVGVEEFTPAIAYDETTYNTLVAWTKHTFPDEYDVYGRLFLKDVPQGPDEFAIANPTVSGQGNPAIAFDGNNNQYLVVWTDDREIGTTQSEVYGQRIAANGTLVGDNFRITDNRPGDQGSAALAFSPDTGKFLVAWEENDQSGSSDLYGRVVDGAGTLPGSIFPISLSGGEQSDVSLAFDSQKNRFLAVWQDTRNNPTTGTDLYGQLFDTHGNPTWPNFAIVRVANEQRYPKVASGSGSFLVAYEYSDLTSFDVQFRQIADPGFLFLPLILK